MSGTSLITKGKITPVIEGTGGEYPSVSEIVDAVWNETRGSHNVVGSFGETNQIIIPSENIEDYKADISLLSHESTLEDMRGSTFNTATDSLEAIRDRGDDAWLTGAGGSSPTVEEIRQEMDVNSTLLSSINLDVHGLNGEPMRGTNDTPSADDINSTLSINHGLGSWLTGAGGSSPTVEEIRTEMDNNSIRLDANISSRSPTNEYDTEMGRIDVNVSSRNAIAPNTVIPDAAGTAATLHGITDALLMTIDGIVDDIKSETDNLPSGITRNEALPRFDFLMVLASDHITAATGRTVIGEISKDGGAFTGITNPITEVASGMYTISSGLTQTEMDADVITLKFDEFECDTRIITLLTT